MKTKDIEMNVYVGYTNDNAARYVYFTLKVVSIVGIAKFGLGCRTRR